MFQAKCSRVLKSNLAKTGIAFALALSTVLPASLIGGVAVSAHAAETLSLSRGQAKVFRVSRPAGTIIIGNPDILSANLQDSETLILTGAQFGTTNMIVLDNNGEAIIDRLIVVEENEQSTVRVYSSGSTATFACNAACNQISN